MSDALRIAIRAFEPFERSIRKQYADFQAVTGCPLRLEPEQLELNPLVDTLFTQQGLKDGTWDIAFIVTDWIADAVECGTLVDLAPFMQKDPIPDYPDGWSPALTRYQQFGDAIYGIPYHDGPECFTYRRDLFEDPAEQAAFAAEHDYPLAVPRTWREFEEIARFFTRPDQNLYGTIFAAYPDGHNTVYDFCLQLWSRGGELTDANGVPTLDTPAAVAGLDFYRRIVNDRSVTPPHLEEIDSVKSGELFASGSVAMMVNWFGFAAVCEQPSCPMKGKVAVASLPAGEAASSASLNVYWLLCVGSGSRHKEEAFAFISHASSPEMDTITTLEGGIGCRLSTWRDPEVNAAIPFYHRLAELHEQTRELPRSRGLPRLVHIIDAAVQSAISGDEPTEEILRRAQSEAAEIRL
ncbi:MAG: extracellular solute-binding protein [Thermomicrobiales bacterium]